MTMQQWPESLIQDYRALLSSGGGMHSHLISPNCEVQTDPFATPIKGKDFALRYLWQILQGEGEFTLQMQSETGFVWHVRQTEQSIDLKLMRHILLIISLDQQGVCEKLSVWRVHRVDDTNRTRKLAGQFF